MGRLTDDMTRLRDGINAARDARLSLLACMKNGNKARLDAARHAKRERLAFLGGLRKTVRGLRKDVASDLAGARRAWSGKRP